MAEEILDIVNDQDEVIGQIPRSEMQRLVDEKLGFLRAVDLFIINSQGQLWIPTRTAHKVIAPNGLDYSAGGHVSSGDTYDSTVIKETEEELNFTPDPERIEFIMKFSPSSAPYFRAVYFYKTDDTPQFNPEDFVSAEWLAPDELLAKLDSGVPAKSSIKETVEALLAQGKI
jgi:isopentenyl-diphosphate delta-isomerase